MLVNGQREVAKDNAQSGKIVGELVQRLGKRAARRTLEVTEFFQRNRGIGRAQGVQRSVRREGRLAR
jgi:hypothetical protein